jgi:hypothetical protein
MAGWMINCKEHATLISRSSDQSIPFWKWVSMKIHQFLCPSCRQAWRQIDTIRNACRFTPDDAALADMEGKQLSDEACQQIKSVLHKIAKAKDS